MLVDRGVCRWDDDLDLPPLRVAALLFLKLLLLVDNRFIFITFNKYK
jgi:hypothetical protein